MQMEKRLKWQDVNGMETSGRKKGLGYFMKKKNFIKSAAIGLMCIFTLAVFTACGAKDSGEAEAVPKAEEAAATGTEETAEESEAEKSVEEQIAEEIAEMRSQYIYVEEPDMSVSQLGNYVIDGVELCDAVEAPQEMNSAWEGYSEEELGFLSPDNMPNCTLGGEDCHFISYDGVIYVYVNDYNAAFAEYSILPYAEYANVWCSVEDGRVLGGLEEYGRKCAQEKGGAE